MQVLKGLQRLFQFITESYCLLTLALQNQLKKPTPADSTVRAPEKGRAKAMNAD
jgi:hypothetical protein